MRLSGAAAAAVKIVIDVKKKALPKLWDLYLEIKSEKNL